MSIQNRIDDVRHCMSYEGLGSDNGHDSVDALLNELEKCKEVANRLRQLAYDGEPDSIDGKIICVDCDELVALADTLDS